MLSTPASQRKGDGLFHRALPWKKKYLECPQALYLTYVQLIVTSMQYKTFCQAPIRVKVPRSDNHYNRGIERGAFFENEGLCSEALFK
jgi:hypothetical protein